MNAYLIKYLDGYWCGQRRTENGGRVHFWSSKRRDAKRIGMFEAAVIIAKHLPEVQEISRCRVAPE
jgi:hypothetical protein